MFIKQFMLQSNKWFENAFIWVLRIYFFNLTMCRLVFLGLNFLIEYLNKIALLYNT